MNKKKSLEEQEKEVKSIIAYKIKQSGLTLTQLAKKSNLSLSTVYKLSEEKMLPRVSTLYKISKGLGITLAELFKKETND